MASPHIIKLKDVLIDKRKSQVMNCTSHFTSNNHHHMCCILNKSGEILSYGYNIYNIKTPTTEHAEAQAFRKLQQKIGTPQTTKKIKIDILVVRTNGSNSKPCTRCIEKMVEVSSIFSIKNVFYTHKDTPSGLKCERFIDLVNDPDKHISSYERYQMKKQGIVISRSTSQSSLNDNISDESDSSECSDKQCRMHREFCHRKSK
jgi:cytidine deaminase